MTKCSTAISLASAISNLLSILGVLVLLCLGAKAAPTYLSIHCAINSTYAPNSPFQGDLNALFSSLSSTAITAAGFHNSTVGAAYGVFLCRGDVSPAVCRDCVRTATKEATGRCPKSKVATIWYDECMLRYSDRSIFSVADQSNRVMLYNTQNVNEPWRFRDLLGEVVNDVADRASKDRSGKKFATREANFSALQELYALAQCTPDLTSSDCNTCLRDAIASLPSCCDGKRGGRVLFPSCNVRFEFYPFYNVTAAAAPPLREASPGTTGKKGNRSLSYETIVYIVVAICSVLVFSLVAYLRLMKAKTLEKVGYEHLHSQFETASTETYNMGEEMKQEMAHLRSQLTECKARITELEELIGNKGFRV